MIKLKYFKKWVSKRRSVARQYFLHLSDLSNFIKLPVYKDNSKFYETFNSFVLRAKNRNNLKKFLLKNKIEVFSHIDKGVHLEKNLYKKKITLKNTEKIEKEIISLPIYPELKKKIFFIFVKKSENFMKIKKEVIVTGGSGFLGKNLIQSISKKYKIISVDRKIRSNSGNFTHFKANIKKFLKKKI